MNTKLTNSATHKISRDYTFDFKPILNNAGLVRFIDHYKNQEKSIGFNINDHDFRYRVQSQFPSIIADLIDLAVVIYACDRLACQDLNKIRRIYVTLPVRHPELFKSHLFQQKLNNLLMWTTESAWFFEFTERQISRRCVEQQLILSFPNMAPNTEVALWSAGLDSLAGLYTRLKTNPDNSFILFGSGSNKRIYSDQKKLFEKVESIFPGRLSLSRVLISFDKSGDIPKNKLSRGRGILFTLLGSACAYLMGQRELFVYENGIGAINLGYSRATVGLDHSRSVHPKTLLMVGDLVSELIEEKFEVKNPYLFWTKAQMCKVLAQDQRNNLIVSTASCDHPHRQTIISQCGYCSSCLLRRQALIAANLEDKTHYVITHSEKPLEKDRSSYFRSMQKQVETLDSLLQISNETKSQWKELTKEFLDLDDIVELTYELEDISTSKMQSLLIQLYKTYVSEWKNAECILEKSFFNPSLAIKKN